MAGKTPVKMGRPTTYTQELINEVCARIAEGQSLRQIVEDDNMPGLRTIMTWLGDPTKEYFKQQYAKAKETQADSYEDRMLVIAQTEPDVQRARLIIDTMKWTASKLKPKKYGDKLDVTSDGKALPTPLLGGISTQEESPK